MRAWTVLLPHFVFAWLARRRMERLTAPGLGPVVIPRPGVYLRAHPIAAARVERAGGEGDG